MSGFRRWAAALVAATGTALILLAAPTAGIAAADPTPSIPAPSIPSAGPSAGADPSADSGTDSGGPDEIKYGTADQGQIHWERFGGSDHDSAGTLDQFAADILGYAMTGFGIAAVLGGTVVCGLMIAGVRGRSQVAKTALESSIWIWVALLIAGSVSSIGGIVLTAGIG